MATNITVYDIINYPNNSRTVTVDLKKVTPYGEDGDEKWVLSATTTATASGSAAIQDTFVDYSNVGWSKSNGIPTEPFTINGSQLNMKVAIDEGVSGAATISLATSDTPISGDSVAADIQNKIHALTVTGAAKAGNLSYLNTKCVYENGRFIITSGSLAQSFTGAGRTSVAVAAGATNDVTSILGFDIDFPSEFLDGQNPEMTYVDGAVVASTTVPVGSVTNFTAGDCVGFKNSAGTLYYRYIDSVSSPNLIVNTAISVDDGTIVQLLRLQDPEGKPASYYTRIDDSMRHAIDLLIQQINFA
jgi:hypothetical protein